MPDILRPKARPEGLVADAGPIRPHARPEGLGEVPPVVAEAATVPGALDPGTALIGLFLAPSGGSALLRLPSGEVRKVHEGDAVAGGVVVAIAEDGLHLRRGSAEQVLALPA